MKKLKSSQRLIACIVAIVMLALPLLAQQRHVAPKKPAAASEPAPTFDSLLAADSYKVYCEIRGVGGLIRSSAVNDLLDPVMKLGGPPKEFKTLVKWLNAHADVLAGSRMMVAGWSSRPKLPNVVVAIEFSSPEEAKKFYPELRDFLPKLLPTPTPTPTPSPAQTPAPAAKPGTLGAASPSGTQVTRTELIVPPTIGPQNVGAVADKPPEPAGPPYQMKQAGSLVFISDTAFTFRDLKPRGSKPLEEDQNFLTARNRFSSESVFLYVDLKAIEKEEKERRQKYEEEEQKRIELEAANPPKAEESPDTTEPAMTESMEEVQTVPSEPSSEEPVVIEETADSRVSGVATLSGGPQPGTDEVAPIMYSLYGALFGGEVKWPEAIGAGLVFEGDAYVVRTLIINNSENKGNAIPFVPQFVTGPTMVPESPNIFPADIDLFVSVSLDYPQVYEGMLKAMANAQELERKYRSKPTADGPLPETPFAAYEKKLGIKIKDDLLPLLGNELALVLPRKAKKAAKESSTPRAEDSKAAGANQPNPNQGPNPVIAISIKDREAVGKLIPKLIEGFGLKGASLLAQTEKRDGTEIVSYAGIFSYAFVGDFLVLSPDPAETRHVVDAYLNHQTLSSDSHFRNYTRWQPRQVLGQVYVAPGLVEEFTSDGRTSGVALNDKVSEFLSGVNPVIDPLTYSLSNDGLGPFHELHVPKNLLMVLVAGMSAGASEALPASNEAAAKSMMRTVATAEAMFKVTDNSYGTVDQLVSAGLLNKEMIDKYGYRIEVAASKDKFEATAIPLEYGRTGKLSYFMDESQVLRGGDHGGGAATLSDPPL
ncbi:MAG: DUF3352 domain-containing protein [bacterium]